MSGSLTSVPVVSLLAFCFLHAVWASSEDRLSVPVDVVILLDNSNVISREDFQKIKEFLKSFVNGFNVGPSGMNLGVVSSDGSPNIEFTLNSFVSIDALHSAIDGIKYTGKNPPHVVDALSLVRENVFTKLEGDRDYAPNVLIVIADGRVNDHALVNAEAAELKKTNINVFVLTSHQKVINVLNAIASKDENVFHLPSFQDLENIHSNLIEVVSEGIPSVLPSTPAGCISVPADVVFLVDNSKYMWPQDYDQVKIFMKNFVHGFDVGPKGLNVAVITFNLDVYPEFRLNSYTTRSSLLAAIGRIRHMGKDYPDVAKALSFVRRKVFIKASGDRDGAPNILIVIADGRFQYKPAVKAEAAELKETNIGIFVVASHLTEGMQAIASKDENIFHAAYFKDFENVHRNIISAVAEEIMALLPPTPTATPSPSETPATLSPSETPATPSPSYAPATQLPSEIPATQLPSEIPATQSPSEIPATLSPSYAPATQSPSETPATVTAAPLYFHPPPPCVDGITSCAEYGFFYCNPDSLWAQYICRRHCGTCVQHCDYKGQWYSQGAKWQDGCAYVCECVDGATGYYQCYSKCPTYLYLLPHCTLVHLPGLCCLQPVCNFGAVYQTVGGQNAGYFNGYQVCVYNGAKYYQSQRWTVGCDMECFCYDASIGLFTCHSKCAQYGVLPSNCRLVKKPDECCAKPECKFDTTMGPFIGVGQPSGSGQSVYSVFTF